MPVDLFTALEITAVVVLGLVALLMVVTMVLSAWYTRRERRRAKRRRYVRTELFERLRRDEPDWAGWVAALSAAEQTQLAAVVERYLRTVSGDDRRVYLDIAVALGMGERVDRRLESEDAVTRSRAVARLTLLEYPVSSDRLLETCLADQQSREAAARLLHERRESFQRPGELAVGLLVWEGRRPMTTWGLQTLREHSDGDPCALLLQGGWGADDWGETVLEQSCSVLGASQTTTGPEAFGWVFEQLDHESPRVRAAAVEAFRQAGWRDGFGGRIPFRRLFADSSRVRRAAYRVLSYWGDERARELLQWAVIDEDDARTQLLAVRALASLEPDFDPGQDQPGWPDRSWDWVRAEIEAAEGRRLLTRSDTGGAR